MKLLSRIAATQVAATNAQAAYFTFTAALSGLNGVPPSVSTAVGGADAAYDDVSGSPALTAAFRSPARAPSSRAGMLGSMVLWFCH